MTACSWSSSDTSVATIDGSGLVTAIANGTTELSATTQNVTATKKLAVRAGVRLLWVYPMWYWVLLVS